MIHVNSRYRIGTLRQLDRTVIKQGRGIRNRAIQRVKDGSVSLVLDGKRQGILVGALVFGKLRVEQCVLQIVVYHLRPCTIGQELCYFIIFLIGRVDCNHAAICSNDILFGRCIILKCHAGSAKRKSLFSRLLKVLGFSQVQVHIA